MQHLYSALAIIGVSLAIALAAITLVVFRPSARRRRRHKRRSHRPKIDLFAQPRQELPAEPELDA